MMGNKSFVFRFDDVEVREREFSLVKAGKEVTVEPKAFRTLLLLLRNPQKLVTKEELLNTVWGDTAVTDGSLTRCIWLLRRLLGDDVNEPRYIATVATVGYRFVCPVEVEEYSPAIPDTSKTDKNGKETSLGNGKEPLPLPAIAPGASTRSRWLWAIGAGGVIAGAVLLMAWWRTPPSSPSVDFVTQITDDGQIKGGGLSSDASRIYFNEGPPLTQKIGQVSIKGGPTVRVETKLVNPTLEGVKPDGSELIVLTGGGSNVAYPLWAMPLPAGEPRRLGSAEVDAAGILPDGRVMFATGKDLFIADQDGSNTRKLASLPGRIATVEPSPDSKRILLQLDMKGDNTLDTYEVAADGTAVRAIRNANLNECRFHWSWDGNYLLYSVKAGNRWDIWALPIHEGLFRTAKKPIRLTTGPLSFSGGAIPSRDGKQIFAVASKQHGELLRYDLKLRQFLPLLSGISATDATFSDDGKWVAYLAYPDHSVWRSRSDGTERMQLTFPPVEAQTPFISPDGARVAYTTDSGTFLIDTSGDQAQKIYGTSLNPMWSPDGKTILITINSGGINYSMQMIDAGTGKASPVPASEGKGGGFWLDQKTLIAGNATQTKLLTLDLDSGKWTDFFTGSLVNWINSPDRKYVYIATGGPEPIVQRIRVSDRQAETIVSLKDFAELSNFGWTQLRVAPDGSPTLTRALDTQEIYALGVHLP
jgi:DNA-binding winged helix-turn-helix (wHTH) protein/Tol biopolymer transport system component